ncbi:hypothetical protein EZ315_15240 [Duncaniella freteri]|uniref:Uncharacterized protein n=1 Tax=Duncaniella freteri TaxID=2530391 RepID=A0A4Z0V738_9BACT|nr:hypothetical protein [Duncaniella freteri]TGG37143.1 hypothetical protein EZ315_15240 [Duncaniella freteri]
MPTLSGSNFWATGGRACSGLVEQLQIIGAGYVGGRADVLHGIGRADSRGHNVLELKDEREAVGECGRYTDVVALSEGEHTGDRAKRDNCGVEECLTV